MSLMNDAAERRRADGCPTEELLLSFCKGRLGDADIDEVGDHLEVCEACEEAVDRLEGRSDSFASLAKKPPNFSDFGPDLVPQVFLRRRLWLWSLLLGCGLLATSILEEFGVTSFMNRSLQSSVFQNPSSWIIALLTLTLALLIRCGCFRGLAWLRLSEAVILGLLTIRIAALEVGMIGSVLASAENFSLERQMLAGNFALPAWMVLISSYAVFVPNTPKRLATILLMLIIIACGIAWMMVENERFDAEARAAIQRTFVVFLGINTVLCIVSAQDQAQLRRAAAWKGSSGYLPIRPLGSGGMGEVWLAEHRRTQERFAIKFMRRHLNGDVSSIRRFVREIKMASGFSHPNIVAIHDHGVGEDGSIFYVMEYVKGRNLEQVVHETGPMCAQRVTSILGQLVSALESAHGAGRVHRDIKPSNVLLCDEPADLVKLTDFGLARRIKVRGLSRPVTTASEIPGTPGFIAPEVLEGEASDARSDIYSLGVLGYFLLTGKLPFAKETSLQIILAQIRGEIIPPSTWIASIPATLESIILRCLARSSAGRYCNAAEVGSALSLVGFETCDSNA